MSTTPSAPPALRLRDLDAQDDFTQPASDADVLLIPAPRPGRYRVGYAVSGAALAAAQRLRFEVFNVELGEGLAESEADGHDRDRFDPQMSHLLLMDTERGEVAGTYRMQTAQQAAQGLGFYCADYFDLAPLAPWLDQTIELGRACLGRDHRTHRAILTLWGGVAHYVARFNQRYLMGCCSITTRDPDDGWRAMKQLRAQGALHPDIVVAPRAGRACGPVTREQDPALGEALALPKLFRTYMKLGARVVSGPAIDREFGTVDFLAFMDGREVALAQLDVLN
jgi:putative hemolysin